MKILIAGSRTITQYPALFNFWHKTPYEWRHPEPTIISGCASGVDTLAIFLAESLQLDCIKMPANWKKHGKAAGFIRNKEMVDLCDVALILWDEKSRGTENTIKLLKAAKKQYELFTVDPYKRW